MDFKDVADKIFANLSEDDTELVVKIEIEAKPTGFAEGQVRTLSENAQTLNSTSRASRRASPPMNPRPGRRQYRAQRLRSRTRVTAWVRLPDSPVPTGSAGPVTPVW